MSWTTTLGILFSHFQALKASNARSPNRRQNFPSTQEGDGGDGASLKRGWGEKEKDQLLLPWKVVEVSVDTAVQENVKEKVQDRKQGSLVEGAKRETSLMSGCKKKGNELGGSSNVNQESNLWDAGEIQKECQREDLNDKGCVDSMWIDGSTIDNKVCEREGRGSDPADKKLDQTNCIGRGASKNKGNRGWKRLVREVSNRAPLRDKNEEMEVDNEGGKRKSCVTVDKENEYQKKYKTDGSGAGLEQTIEVVESYLNGAPKFQ